MGTHIVFQPTFLEKSGSFWEGARSFANQLKWCITYQNLVVPKLTSLTHTGGRGYTFFAWWTPLERVWFPQNWMVFLSSQSGECFSFSINSIGDVQITRPFLVIIHVLLFSWVHPPAVPRNRPFFGGWWWLNNHPKKNGQTISLDDSLEFPWCLAKDHVRQFHWTEIRRLFCSLLDPRWLFLNHVIM